MGPTGQSVGESERPGPATSGSGLEAERVHTCGGPGQWLPSCLDWGEEAMLASLLGGSCASQHLPRAWAREVRETPDLTQDPGYDAAPSAWQLGLIAQVPAGSVPGVAWEYKR